MATQSEYKVQIVGGFSREDLRDTLRRDQRGDPMWVTVTVIVASDMASKLEKAIPIGYLRNDREYGVDLRLNISAIAWEDGSAQSWNISGVIQNPGNGCTKFSAYYHTGNRKGTMTIKV